MKKYPKFTSLLVLVIMGLAACKPGPWTRGTPTLAPADTAEPAQTQVALREAHVESVTIQMAQSDPMQVNAVVNGYLTEACATMRVPQLRYADKTFYITLLSASPTDRGCMQITTPFEYTISLNTVDLPRGAYTVIANGVSAGFTLPFDTTPTVVPSPSGEVSKK